MPLLRPEPTMGTFIPRMGTHTSPDSAAQVLFGSVRRAVLALLFGHADERYYFREVLRAVGGGSGALQRELQQLVAAGLVTREVAGHQVYFSANRAAPIFPELKAIVEKTAGAADVLRTALASFHANGQVDLALIYGSIASGTETAKSDVDVLIVGDATLSELVPALRRAEARLRREVNASVYPAREFREKLKRGGKFLARVVKGPKLFLVGDERELGRLAR